MKKDDKYTGQELEEIAQAIQQVGSRPSLSRRQKKTILKSILPRQPLLLRIAPAFSAVFFAGILLIGSLSFASQPGDALYGIKRGIEDARSVVQPSYNEKLLQKRNDEIEDLAKKGSDDSKLDIANNEKHEIEKRLKSSEDSNDSKVGQKNDSAPEHTDSNKSESSSSSTSAEQSPEQRSTKEQCKLSLDARKNSGESISSDMYKQCED